MFRFSFDPLFGSYGFVLLIVLLFAVVLLYIRPTSDRLARRGSRLLLLFRTLSLLVLCFAMLRPTLVYTKTERLASVLNILLDQSESMSRSDELGGNTRYRVALESLLAAQPELKRLQQYTEIHCSAFDATLHPLPISEGILKDVANEPKGKETAIGAVLDAVRDRSSGKRVLGTILLSDGNQKTRPPRDILPYDAAVRLRDAGIPLYAVRLGQSGGITDVQDISVDDIQANDRVFVRNNLLISGTMRITGYKNLPVPVQLFFEDDQGKMRQVEEQEVRSTEEGQVVSYRFSYAPMETGYFKYTVRVPVQTKELIDTNNEQSHFVRVIEGGLNVLFLQGERQMEQRMLRQSLDASTDIQVVYRPLRLGKLRAEKQGASTFQKSLERFTAERASWMEEFEPGKYNVYMLDDIDAKAFKPEELRALAQRVQEGCGLIMLGGLHSFGAGGYADTHLAQVSPVELRSVDRQPLNAPIRRDIHWNDPIRMFPKQTGNTIPYVMKLASRPEENVLRWMNMPPLIGANRFDKIKGGATVLAEGPKEERLLVSQLYGLGRVLAFAGDSTYRWRVAGFVEEHKQFWRQIILWLARMDGLMQGDCWITVENVRLMPGEPAQFQVFVKKPDGEERQHFQADAFVKMPDGSEQRVPLVDQNGVPSGAFRETSESGDYTIRVAVPPDKNASSEEGVRTAEARFMVFDRNLEMDNPGAFPKLLENLSTLTGGHSIAPEQLPLLLEELGRKADEFVEKRETSKTLYDDWWVLLTFILLLAIEWFLRKRWGLA